MQCVTPMFRRYEQGKHSKGQIVPRSEVLKDLNYDPNYIRKCLDDVNSYNRKTNNRYLYEQIACGHCWACRLNYSAQWATRIMYECKNNDHNYFITFTYDDDHLPIPESTEYNGINYTNDGTWSGSLFPDDISRFINSLRKHLERDKNHTGVKYFYAGEYGTQEPYQAKGTLGHRPHYHMILMNCPLDVSQFYDFNLDERNKLHWKSHEIEKYWQEGMIDIGEVEFASAAYVARYCMKKLSDEVDKTEYYKNGKLPEFVRMSRRPGIGKQYILENMEDIYKTDELLVRNFKGDLMKVKPPRAWDNEFKKTHPEEWFKIKRSRREAADRGRKLLQEISDQTDLQRLQINQRNILTKSNQLPRVGEW